MGAKLAVSNVAEGQRVPLPRNVRRARAHVRPVPSLPQQPIADDGGGLADLELVRFVSEIAATSSFTQAARQLGIDQSWLSKRIRHFEAALGVKLFERTTRSVKVTRAAALLLEPAERLAEVDRDARSIIAQLRGTAASTLRIGALPFSFPDSLRKELVDRFMSDHPDIGLSITSGPTPRLLDALRGGQIDVAFISAPIDTREFDSVVFWRSPYVLLMPEDHPAAHARDLLDMMIGRPVLTPLAGFSPAAYERYYQPLVDAGLVPVSVPEFQSTASYAEQWGLPVVCTEMAADQYRGEKFVIRPLDLVPECEKLMVRLSCHRTPAQTALWEMAVADVEYRARESLPFDRE